MAKVIGIDLGTTNSVAAIKKVHTEIIKNVEGELITPSCVNIQKGKSATTRFVVGRDALEWLKQDPENTITAIKRLIGRSYNEPEVDHLLKDHRLAYKVSKNSKGSENSLVIQANGQEYTAEEISAKILTKIKRDTEKNEGSKVEFAVITVPAYFNDKQKHATRIAAAQAGLKVQRLLPEPTAAAISFGVDQIKDDEAKVVLVFDFGGGTLDLSVLTISGGQFIEQGKGGDMWLGGDDIDRLLSDYVLSATAEEYGIENIENLLSQTETRKRNQFLTELKSTVEQAKIKLSSKDSAWVEILGLLRDQDGDSIDIEVELTRDRLDELLQPIVASIIKMADDVIESIHFSPDLIDQVLLVGGSSKIPLIVTAMREKFGVEKVVIHDRPMLAIAEGAAILSHRLADNYECPECGQAVDQGDTNCPKCHFDLERYTIDHGIFDIVHSAAHDYYIQLTDNQRHLLIEKNTPLPCVINETFKFVSLDQKMVHLNFFNVVNGEEQWVGDLWLGIDNKELEKENCNFSEENPLQV
ncbi:MAG: Hsp70 family protein, partial [Thermodesulfobacteriota bacterium]|nr:Hsp70 family protein [Thermodesulfobacteriota bacterium]